MSKPSAIMILGPTASGKTGLAIDLAEKLNGEVISIDSALVYEDMDIGTAKPSMEEQRGIAHHLIDIRRPDAPYSVAEFVEDALAAMADVHRRGKLPILAGGTMMYAHSLISDLADLPQSDELVRQRLQQQADSEGLPHLHNRLRQIDPVAAEQIPVNNQQRLLRALEVYEISGRPISSFWSGTTQHKGEVRADFPFDLQQIAVMPADRAVLHQRIEQRLQMMWQAGFVNEVEKLLKYYDLEPDMPSLRAVGYRQVWQYLQGDFDQKTLEEKALIATRQLAKRQITWLRSWRNLKTFDTLSKNLQDQVLKSVHLSGGG